jgi:hypothetical protein
MASELISCSIRRLQAGACLKNKILGKSVSSNRHRLIGASAASSLARQLAKKLSQRKLQFQECNDAQATEHSSLFDFNFRE